MKPHELRSWLTWNSTRPHVFEAKLPVIARHILDETKSARAWIAWFKLLQTKQLDADLQRCVSEFRPYTGRIMQMDGVIVMANDSNIRSIFQSIAGRLGEPVKKRTVYLPPHRRLQLLRT